jgi:20S proteasome subunit alpha 3
VNICIFLNFVYEGILSKNGIVLAADKAIVSKLLDQEREKEKLYKVDDHILCAVAGWTADANILLNHARVVAQRHLYSFDEPQLIEQLIIRICDTKHGYTQYGGLRPFGVSFLIGGWDRQLGFQLYYTDPAGNYSGSKAMSVGRNSQSAQSILRQVID